MPRPAAVENARVRQRKLKEWFGGLVQRGVAQGAGNGPLVMVSTYDGKDMSGGVGIARLRGPEINTGDTLWMMNVTGNPKGTDWLILGPEGGRSSGQVFGNSWSSATETSTTNSATPVAVLSNNWTLPAGTYTIVFSGIAGMRNNGSTATRGYLAIRVDGTIIASTTIGIATSSGAEPVVRVPVTVAGNVTNKSGTVLIELIFRNADNSTTVTCWCYCPMLSVTAQRTA